MDERSQKFFKTKPRGVNQEVILPDFPDDDNTTTTTFTKSRRVSFGTNFIKEFIVGSAVSAQCVTEYERAFSSSDSSNANSSHSAIESGVFDKDTYVLDESHKTNHMPPPPPPPDPETESRAKVPKISSTICFSADSPTTEMEFTEGCISLAKSILDKKNKDMTVIIQAKGKDEDKGKPEETKIFEGSQFDMSMTKCFKPKENKIEERRFECDKTRIFSKFDDEISFTRCSRVFETQTVGVDDESDSSWMGDDQKENQIPLDLIMKHLDKDDSNFENFLFNPEKRLNDVLGSKPVDSSYDSEKLNCNDSMDISNDSPKFMKSVLDELKSGVDVIEKVADVFGKKAEDSFLETLVGGEEIQKESPEEMEITFVKELEVSSDVTLAKVVSSVEIKDVCGVTFIAEKMEVDVKDVAEEEVVGGNIDKGDVVEEKIEEKGDVYVEKNEDKGDVVEERSEDKEGVVEQKNEDKENVVEQKDEDNGERVQQNDGDKTKVVEEKIENMEEVAEEKIEDMKKVTEEKIEDMKEVAEEKIEDMKEVAEEKIEDMKEVAEEKIEDMEEVTKEKIENMEDVPVEMIEHMQNVDEEKLSKLDVSEQKNEDTPFIEKENSLREEIPKADDANVIQASAEKLDTSKIQDEIVTHESTLPQSTPLNESKQLGKQDEIPLLEGSLSKHKQKSFLMSPDKLVPPSPICNKSIESPKPNESFKECQNACGVTFTAENMEVEEVKIDQEEVNTNDDKLDEVERKNEETLNMDKETSLREEAPNVDAINKSTLPENNPPSPPNQPELSKAQDENIIHESTLPSHTLFQHSVEKIEETPVTDTIPECQTPAPEPSKPNETIEQPQPHDEKMDEDEIETSQNIDMSLTKPHIPEEPSQHNQTPANDSMNDFMDVEEEKENELLNSKGEVSLTGLIEMDETLDEMNVSEQPVKEKTPPVENSPLEITTCFMNVKVVKSLEEQSTEPGCVWSLKDFNNPRRNSKGLLSFSFDFLESCAVIKFDLEVSNEDDLEPCRVVNSEVCLEKDTKLRLPEYKTVLEFGFEKFSKHFQEVRKGIRTIHHVSFFLDQMNLFVQKTNPFLRQVYSILTLYPRSKLEDSILTFRIFSYPIFFSCNVSINLSDFSKLSKSSLSYSFDFGSLDKKKIAEILEECLKMENALCEFIIRSTEYVIGLERKTGRISSRKHIRLLSAGKKA